MESGTTAQATPSWGDGSDMALTADDFETASIRSAAPSYRSEAPSYHSTAPQAHEGIPPYTHDRRVETGGPAERTEEPISSPAQTSNLTSDHNSEASAPQQDVDHDLGRSPTPRRLPPTPLRTVRPVNMPQLAQFKIPTWSTISANPTARHYHNVAQRRAQTQSDPVEKLRRNMTQQTLMDEEQAQSRNFRPLEDPYLVGEVAARQAKALRLMRESGEDILIREDRRWDWFLSQMADWEGHEGSWQRFRRDVIEGRRGKLARRIGDA